MKYLVLSFDDLGEILCQHLNLNDYTNYCEFMLYFERSERMYCIYKLTMMCVFFLCVINILSSRNAPMFDICIFSDIKVNLIGTFERSKS